MDNEQSAISMSPRPVAEHPTVMTWATAQAELLDGKRLTRVAWGNDDHVFLFAEILHLRKSDGTLHVLMVSSGDMTAEDWMVVQSVHH